MHGMPHMLQVSFRKKTTNHQALLRKPTYKDKASYGSLPPCKPTYCLCCFFPLPVVCVVCVCVCLCVGVGGYTTALLVLLLPLPVAGVSVHACVHVCTCVRFITLPAMHAFVHACLHCWCSYFPCLLRVCMCVRVYVCMCV